MTLCEKLLQVDDRGISREIVKRAWYASLAIKSVLSSPFDHTFVSLGLLYINDSGEEDGTQKKDYHNEFLPGYYIPTYM